jgi:6-phosphogluconolactonase
LDHADSNYKAVHDGLLSQVPVKNVYTIRSEDDPAKAAEAYEADMRKVFPGDLPSLDLCLLGMGPDGHTCSLFPGHKLLKETSCWVAPIRDSPKPPSNRITLTLPVVNNSAAVVFVCKSELPSALVTGKNGAHFYVDKDAAGSIKA